MQAFTHALPCNGEFRPKTPFACKHIVQLYGPDVTSLAANVARFLSDGWQSGDGLLVIATEANSQAILLALRSFGLDPDDLRAGGRLHVLDGATTLAEFCRGDEPDKGLFRLSVGQRVEQLRKNSRSGEVSAYGEMVGLLWTAGRFTAAMALEDMWNDVLRSTGSKLFCGYPIDVFGPSFHTCDVDALLSSHTHFVPADTSHALEQAVFRAMREVLPASAGDLEPRIQAETKTVWAKTLPGEALILWVRQHLSEQADEILGLAQRHYAIASQTSQTGNR